MDLGGIVVDLDLHTIQLHTKPIFHGRQVADECCLSARCQLGVWSLLVGGRRHHRNGWEGKIGWLGVALAPSTSSGGFVLGPPDFTGVLLTILVLFTDLLTYGGGATTVCLFLSDLCSSKGDAVFSSSVQYFSPIESLSLRGLRGELLWGDP